MCKCTPEIRTPFCGKPGCEAPAQQPANARADELIDLVREFENATISASHDLATPGDRRDADEARSDLVRAIRELASDYSAHEPRADLLKSIRCAVNYLRKHEPGNAQIELQAALRDHSTPPPGVSPLAVYAYAMTERHLNGYRLILGFDTLTKVQAAHKEACDLAVLARDALTKEVRHDAG